MRIAQEIDYLVIEHHLKKEGTGVSLPCKADECKCYKVLLEDDDTPHIAVWWEFEKDTTNLDCRLTSLLPSAAEKPRVKRFVEGDPSKGFGPADLRTLPNKEPTIVTNDLASTLLYVIDGNNRVIAQQVAKKSFSGVPAYVCVWPTFTGWAYVPNYHKKNPPQKRVVVDHTVQIEHGDYSSMLVQFAQSLIRQQQYGPATVMAHVACEINVERAFAAGFQARNVSQLQNVVLSLVNGFNLGNPRIRELFTAVTGKEPQQQTAFWDEFTKSATRRNKFVHNGKPITEVEARKTMQVVGALINYIRTGTPMRFFVQVAFDLKGATPSEYDKLATGLRQIHLSREVDNGSAIKKLPFNTFAGYIDATDAQAAIDRVRGEFALTEFWEGIAGQAFITASPAELSYQTIEFGKARET